MTVLNSQENHETSSNVPVSSEISSKQRKLEDDDQESRKKDARKRSQKSREYDYFVSQISTGSGQIVRCLLCLDNPESKQPTLNNKVFNVRSHYETAHLTKLKEEGLDLDSCNQNVLKTYLRKSKISDQKEKN